MNHNVIRFLKNWWIAFILSCCIAIAVALFYGLFWAIPLAEEWVNQMIQKGYGRYFLAALIFLIITGIAWILYYEEGRGPAPSNKDPLIKTRML